MPASGYILFVSDTPTLFPHVYGRIVDLLLSGTKHLAVGLAFAHSQKGILVVGNVPQPSVQALKQLQQAAALFEDGDAMSYESFAAVADDAVRFALQLPAFTSAAHRELVVMSNVEYLDTQRASHAVFKMHQNDIRGYAVGPRGTAIEGLEPPPWLDSDGLRPPPPKVVSPVKTYEGPFTVGDPANPLISISVVCYPATRRAAAMTPSNFHGEHVAVSSYQMQTSEGPPNRPEDIQRGFTYLSEVVTANIEVQKLMDGEFNGAEYWPKAFELLATVPEVPPWIPLGSSDVVVGKDDAAAALIAALHNVLKDNGMHAMARLSKGARGSHLKGAVELSLLQPFGDNLLLRTPLPYKEDFKSYYRFVDIPSQPREGEESLDALMDELVGGMRVDMPDPLPRNPTISRIGEFIKDYFVSGHSRVPPRKPLLEFPDRPQCREQSSELASQFGITEQAPAPNAAAEPSQEVSYQATQTEINIDDLL